MVEATSTPYNGPYTAGIGCPICGMHVPRSPDNFFASVKGNQVVETCSAKHATAVVNSGSLPEPSTTPGPAPHGDKMCVSGTVMFGGFRFTSPVCTIFLLEGIRLGSVGGVIGAVIVTILLGISLEAVHCYRKRYMENVKLDLALSREIRLSTNTTKAHNLLDSNSHHDSSTTDRESNNGDEKEKERIAKDKSKKQSTVVTFRRPPRIPVLARALNSAMFAGALGIAYLLMLIAMTYNATLFIAVIVGLGAGHFIFSDPTVQLSADNQENIDPCCRV